MFIGMRPEVVPLVFQCFDRAGEFFVAIEFSCKEERSFDVVILKGLANDVASIREIMSGEDKADLLRGQVCSNDAAMLHFEIIGGTILIEHRAGESKKDICVNERRRHAAKDRCEWNSTNTNISQMGTKFHCRRAKLAERIATQRALSYISTVDLAP